MATKTKPMQDDEEPGLRDVPWPLRYTLVIEVLGLILAQDPYVQNAFLWAFVVTGIATWLFSLVVAKWLS